MVIRNTRELVSALPKINRFGIYELTNQAKAAWQIESLWKGPVRPRRWYSDWDMRDSTQQKA